MREDCTFAPRVEVLAELTRVEALLRVDVVVVVSKRCVLAGVIVLTVVRVVPLLFTRVSTEVDGEVTFVVAEVRLLTFTGVEVVFVCAGECILLTASCRGMEWSRIREQEVQYCSNRSTIMLLS